MKLVLTGIEETRSFIRTYTTEDAVFGNNTDARPGPVFLALVFNNGALKIPCDQATYDRLITYCQNLLHTEKDISPIAKPLRVRNKTIQPQPQVEIEENEVSIFGGDDVPPPPPTESEHGWEGAQDEGEDGIGQI